jgi:hypothetical protein
MRLRESKRHFFTEVDAIAYKEDATGFGKYRSGCDSLGTCVGLLRSQMSGRAA